MRVYLSIACSASFRYDNIAVVELTRLLQCIVKTVLQA